MIGAFVPWRAVPGARGDPGWIVEENGCHTWIGAENGRGYGIVNIGGRPRYVHRVRYEREIGPIPDGMDLDHFACDKRRCCNPYHVRPASRRENLLRGDTLASLNAAKTHCPEGHALIEGNLVNNQLRRGRRCCLICHRAKKRQEYHNCKRNRRDYFREYRKRQRERIAA